MVQPASRAHALCGHVHVRQERGHLRLSHGPCDRRTHAFQFLQVCESFVPRNRSEQAVPLCSERSERVRGETEWRSQCFCDRSRKRQPAAAKRTGYSRRRSVSPEYRSEQTNVTGCKLHRRKCCRVTNTLGW